MVLGEREGQFVRFVSPDGNDWDVVRASPTTIDRRSLSDDVWYVTDATALENDDGTLVWFVTKRQIGREEIRVGFRKGELIRRLCILGVVTVVALARSGAPHAQTPAPNQRVWTGTWEEHDSWAGSGRVGRSQAQITYVYVQGQNEFGGPHWNSRRLTWSAQWEENRFDIVTLMKTAPDERGFTERRYREDTFTNCVGGGTLELGPTVFGSGDDLTPEQRAQLLAPCVTTYQPRDSAVPASGPTPSGTRELLQVLGMPHRRRAHRLCLRKDLVERVTSGRVVQCRGVGADRRDHGGRSERRLRPLRAGAWGDADLRGECAVGHRALPVRARPGGDLAASQAMPPTPISTTSSFRSIPTSATCTGSTSMPIRT